MKYSTMSNRRIKELLDNKIKGHNTAKKMLINALNRSQMRHFQKWVELRPDEELISPSNCLLIGPSGTGKTYLIKCIAEILEFPLLIIDATQLNPAGASGGITCKDLLKQIDTYITEYSTARKNHSFYGTLDRLVVFVDEVDKLADKVGNSEWMQHVQSSFLTLFENNNEYSAITWVFAGAFSKMEKNIKTKSIGFIQNKEVDKEDDMDQKLIAYGLMPELVGRMHNIAELDTLVLDDYLDILIQHILPKKHKELRSYGVDECRISEADMLQMAEKAFVSGQGVRSLKRNVDKYFAEVEFDYEQHQIDVDTDAAYGEDYAINRP